MAIHQVVVQHVKDAKPTQAIAKIVRDRGPNKKLSTSWKIRKENDK